jgi:dienelactone hydrolase
MPVHVRLLSMSGLLTVCLSCTTLPVEGEFFAGRRTANDPNATILILFNHGYSPLAAKTSTPRMPPILRMAAEQNADLVLFSQVRKTGSLTRTDHRRYIEAAIEFFQHTYNIPAEHMILAGHSCGGWGALQTAAWTYPRSGGVIAFAPTCHGQVAQQAPWCETEHYQELGELARRLRAPALIFLYEGDRYYRLADWKAFEATAGQSPQRRVVKLDKEMVLKVCPRCRRDSHGAVYAEGFAQAYFQPHVQALIEAVRASIRGRAQPGERRPLHG